MTKPSPPRRRQARISATPRAAPRRVPGPARNKRLQQAAEPAGHPAGLPLPGGTRPEYVVVVWINPQMRERYPRQPLSLHEACQLGRQADPDGQDRVADREAEP